MNPQVLSNFVTNLRDSNRFVITQVKPEPITEEQCVYNTAGFTHCYIENAKETSNTSEPELDGCSKAMTEDFRLILHSAEDDNEENLKVKVESASKKEIKTEVHDRGKENNLEMVEEYRNFSKASEGVPTVKDKKLIMDEDDFFLKENWCTKSAEENKPLQSVHKGIGNKHYKKVKVEQTFGEEDNFKMKSEGIEFVEIKESKGEIAIEEHKVQIKHELEINIVDDGTSVDNNENDKYKCQGCPKSFKFKSLLMRHCRIHSDKCPFTCNVCGKGFKRKYSRKMHMSLHSDDFPYECSACNKRFKVKPNLLRHRLTHSERRFACGVCNKRFTERNLLNSHMQRMHQIKTTEPRVKEKRFKCKEENEPLHYVKEEEIRIEDSVVDEKKLKEEIAEGNNKKDKFKCQSCPKSFKWKSYLKRHSRVHTEERLYPCKICGKGFKHKDARMKHVFLHSADFPFECLVCNKRFKIKAHFLSHSVIHTERLGEQRFKCQACPKSFKWESEFKRHCSVHTDERPFPCKICGRGFKLKDAQMKHMLLHTTDFPFECLVCKKRFKIKAHLSRHGLVHNERRFACRVCNKLFTEKSFLNRHMRDVHKMKPAEPSVVLQQTFQSKDSLKCT